VALKRSIIVLMLASNQSARKSKSAEAPIRDFSNAGARR
jgi:hypothetical protein